MAEDTFTGLDREALLRHATEIVSAYVSRNEIPSAQVPDLITTVFTSLKGLNGSDANEIGKSNQKPAVSIRRSITWGAPWACF